MPSSPGTLELLARELALALHPLEERFGAGRADALFATLGVRLPDGLTEDSAFASALGAGAASANALPQLIADLTTAIDDGAETAIVAAGAALVEKIGELLNAIDGIASALEAAGASFGGLSPQDRVDISAFTDVLPRRLLDFLLVEYLQMRAPNVTTGLMLLGLIERTPEPGDPANPLKPPFARRVLHVERIPDLINDPGTHFANLYGWGTPGFDAVTLFDALGRFLETFQFPYDILAVAGEPAIIEAYLLTLRANPATNPPGLVGDLRFPATEDYEQTYPLAAPFSLTVSAKARFAADVEATITPPFDVDVRPPTGEVHIDAAIGVKGEDSTTPIVLLGTAGGSRLEATLVSASAGVSATWDSAAGTARGEPLVSAEVKGGKLVVDLSQGDGFIQSLVSGASLAATIEFKARWRPGTGLEFEGGAGIELVIPVHVRLGPIEVQILYVTLRFTPDEPIRVDLAVAVSAGIGPLAVSIDRVGAAAAITFPDDSKGNLGPANLAFGFKPPTGLGVLVKADPIRGGGFLSFDEANGRYAGMLQLEAKGIAVTAIGIVDTKLPGGQIGYSFLIIVFGEFPPVQLGYGFTLNGVGGLAGIHRMVLTDVLRQGLRAGSLDSLMFPVDPIRNAPQIVSDLRAVFPPTQGRFVFGPFLKLGWGVPSLITANLGVILELPDPFRILILGTVRVTLPQPELPIVLLNLDLLGVIDFEQKLLSIDASLYDSRVGPFSVYGDMALRLSWGDPPIFALAIGGLHPQFSPPPYFPQLRRATIEIGVGDNPRLTCQSYLALTSNSLQNGSKIELYAAKAGFNIHGWLGYDALVIFVPFSFLVDIDGGVELRRGKSVIAGIHVSAHLSGPGEWHAWGRACISFFFFDVCVPFDVTIGDPIQQAIVSVNPWPLLEAALKDPRSWESLLPASAFKAVTLTVPEGTTVTLVDPVGVLRGHQKVLPLNRTLEKFGEAKVEGVNRFDLSSVTAGSSTVAHDTLSDFFAAAQYQELTDAEKLSRDSYEPLDSGVAIGAAAATNGFTRPVPVKFETIIIDAPDGDTAPFTRFTKRFVGFHALENASFVSRTERVYGTYLAISGRDSLPVVSQRVDLKDDEYVIVRTLDLTPSNLPRAKTKGQALDLLAAHVRANPSDEGRLQAIPVHELEVA
jgi:hypothetical protein